MPDLSNTAEMLTSLIIAVMIAEQRLSLGSEGE